MKMMRAIRQMNSLGKQRIPFLFIIDFLNERTQVLPLSEVNPQQLLFDVQGVTNAPHQIVRNTSVELEKFPVDFATYRAAFERVQYYIRRGDTYLVNLSFETPVRLNLSLEEIFYRSRARYKLLFNNQWVVFSPEAFCRIDETGRIRTFPMKGTIDASLPDAQDRLANDAKEQAEHTTVVDLLRNDLSQIATNVSVPRFQYLEKITTHQRALWQMSSEIRGQLPSNYAENIGDLLFKMLPAGSISGAPKPKTVSIIREVENYERGYYTGVFGLFDGKQLNSGVMIRFIENKNGQYVFKSGGGITYFSEAEREYQELIDKIYVPIY
ncbi:aminodeoxychorismate synthase component I [Tunicatimonas pelagia]|uniref:aminodeoxychorismate synthase component I n=1 Tax=Tunicatimonas pelagia TaxID=931531 RepID=UPI002665D6B7|nr:aminodeoxychorismate synthase component I [Tunicatimonas pelagia]WKN40500.1 aminodeoxychorismate synthase component I [Tunicatimonas pelagia]